MNPVDWEGGSRGVKREEPHCDLSFDSLDKRGNAFKRRNTDSDRELRRETRKKKRGQVRRTTLEKM